MKLLLSSQISGTDESSDRATKASAAAESGSALQQLDISGCALDDRAAVVLLEGLRRGALPSIRRVDLSGNHRCGEAAAASLMILLGAHRTSVKAEGTGNAAGGSHGKPAPDASIGESTTDKQGSLSRGPREQGSGQAGVRSRALPPAVLTDGWNLEASTKQALQRASDAAELRRQLQLESAGVAAAEADFREASTAGEQEADVLVERRVQQRAMVEQAEAEVEALQEHLDKQRGELKRRREELEERWTKYREKARELVGAREQAGMAEREAEVATQRAAYARRQASQSKQASLQLDQEDSKLVQAEASLS